MYLLILLCTFLILLILILEKEILIKNYHRCLIKFFSTKVKHLNGKNISIKRNFNFLGTINERIKNDINKYGTIYSFNDGPQQIVVLGSYKLAKEFYKKSYNISFREYHYLGYVFDKLLKQCIGVNTGKKWGQMKKPLTKYFTIKSFDEHYNMIISKVTHWINITFQKNNKYFLHNISFDKLTLEILSDIIFGDLTANQKKELYELSILHTKMMNIMGSDMMLRIPLIYKYFNSPNKKLVDNFNKRWIKFNEKIIISPNQNSLLKTMLEYKVYKDNKIDLIHTLYELSLFNLDIMVDSFANLLWNITTHQNIQQKIYDEIISNNSGSDKLEDIKEMCYLNCVVNESARLNPGITLSFAETIDQDILIDNYFFPKGTKVSLDTEMINRDSKIWKNPYKFNPSRFENCEQLLFTKFHRFGIGPRKCLGKIYGDNILKISIIKLIKKFVITTSSSKIDRQSINTIPNIGKYKMMNKIFFNER